jgi:homoserine kinase
MSQGRREECSALEIEDLAEISLRSDSLSILNIHIPDPDMIFLAMQDKVHQPYRKTLIPGLTEILQFMTLPRPPGGVQRAGD